MVVLARRKLGSNRMAISAAVTFCDDIRIENTGKLLLVGVYPDNLVPGALPQLLTLSVWVRLKGVPPGDHNLHFTFGANDEKSIEGDVALKVEQGKETAQLYLVGLPVELKKHGNIFFALTGLPNGEEVHERLPIVLTPQPVAD